MLEESVGEHDVEAAIIERELVRGRLMKGDRGALALGEHPCICKLSCEEIDPMYLAG
jgi:hypothetical protein